MSTIRLFTAVELPPALRRALDVRAMERFMRGGRVRGLSLVPPDNLHITVRFLGDVDEERVPEITEALRAAVAPLTSGAGQLEEFGAFPNPRRPSALWCGVASEVLAPLHQAVTTALTPLGFPPEEREFRPHVTVARVREARTRRVVADRLAAATEPTGTTTGTDESFAIEHLTLFSSSARRPDAPDSESNASPSKGVHYEALTRLPLASAGERP